MWSFEDKAASKGYKYIVGVDEAGRGPLAGPVVSAAVILPRSFSCDGLTDSKQLTPLKREKFYSIIMEHAVAATTGIATSEEIEKLNILQASLLSMKRAVENISISSTQIFPDYLLIDGIFPIESGSIHQEPIVHGDARSVSIAAASIIAKVTRDRIMQELHLQYPCYGFDRHKGYPTKAHKAALAIHGPSPVHRKTFRGCS
ncbi:MAG: ribonuclease HII [Desulfamplus sp.]|nr:ribonuclease HII [Desulfamplus sp.]MBF0412535.1 ribonuclease HII [Desulfamplus sp.]